MKENLLKTSRIFISGSLAPNMFNKMGEKRGFLSVELLTQKEFKDLVDEYGMGIIYSSYNDEVIVRIVEELGIPYKKVEERVELDPERGDILITIRARNYNILKSKEVPEHVTLDILALKSFMKEGSIENLDINFD